MVTEGSEEQPTPDPAISRPSLSEGKRAIRALPPIPLDPPMSTPSSGNKVSVSPTTKGVRLPDSAPHPRSDQHHSSSSRRSKQGSGRHRRLLTELLHLYPHLNQHPSDRTEASGPSLNATNPSPTDSHSHRTHSQPFRQSSPSISEILIMTTEKLHIETARANAAEKQISDVMSLFKNTHDQKMKLEGELSRIRGDLGWYKVQLDVAQKEIFRAQEIVERVDRQRVEAEEAVVRAREKTRKLSEARAVDLAMEEGRRLGFEEGLKHGRIMAHVSESEKSRSKSRTASAGGSGSRKSQPVSQSELPEASKVYKSSARPQRRPPSRTPANDRTTQPVIVDQKRGRRLSRPEDIAIQDADAPRSKSNYRQSPNVSRRSIVLPPDNYIPVLNPDATITLPPPHEMTLPVPPEAPSSFPPRASGTQTPPNRPKSSSGPITIRPGEPPSYSGLGDIRAPIPRRAASPIPKEGPSNSVSKMTSDSTEPRSPSTYPNRPPRRTREIAMPIPLRNHFLPSRTTDGPAHLLPRIANPPEPSAPEEPPTSPHPVRMASYATIPDINVQTPSSKSATSERTVLDPVLLTPEHVNTPLSSHEEQQGESLGLYTEPPKVATPAQLPSGFVPLSPIPGMANLNPYPVGLYSKDHSAAKDSNYVYPSSPLVRPA